MYSKKGRKFQEPGIKNLKSKLKGIGLDIEYVTRKEDIIIYLIYYLGGITLEQLCVIFDVLETSIKTSIARILKKGNIIEIKKNEVNNIFYLPTKKTLTELKKFCDVKANRNYKNIKHLSKVNDFFLTLFKSSCEKLTIEYEKNIGKAEFIVRADAIIKVEKDGNEYEFVLEQDNNTEKVTKLFEKIENYFNLILHEELCPEKIRYYFFRFEVFLNQNHIAKCEKTLKKSKRYAELMKEIDDIQELYYDVLNNDGWDEDFEHRSDMYNVNYSIKRDVLMKNILIAKSELLKKIDRLKRTIRIELSSMRLKDREEKVKVAMLDEFKVKAFDGDSINTVYNDITGYKRFECFNSKLEGKDILLRTNIICGDRKTDYILKNMLFSTKHYLIYFLNDYFDYKVNFDSLKVTQVFKVVGYHTLCFSNYATTHLYDEDYDFVLLMPSISLSDYYRIEYLLNLDLKQIQNSFSNTTHFLIMVEDEHAIDIYKEKIAKFYSNIIGFSVYHVNINRKDNDLEI